MAVYRFYPSKSNTLYSDLALKNAGRDQIVELTAHQLTVSRILLGFDKESIMAVTNSLSNWTAKLRLYAANESGLPESYTIECFSLVGDWKEGTGTYLELPYTGSGSSWKFCNSQTNYDWVSNQTGDTIGSYPVSNPGGGSWLSADGSSKLVNKFISKDFYNEITPIVQNIISGTSTGIIIKLADIHENNFNELINIKYFSEDTNTIYKPVLEIHSNDAVFVPIGEIIHTLDLKVSLKSNFTSFSIYDTVDIDVFVKPKISTLNYSTVYSTATSLRLPQESYWQLRDVNTNEVIIPGSLDSTRISVIGSTNSFKFITQNLECNRFYCFDIFIKVGNSIKSFAPEYVFRLHS